ncbi:MAG TPA: YdcF family protein [Anaerolineales bacterium]|nr:YdcF family protein [Anaerolineales bacterium]
MFVFLSKFLPLFAYPLGLACVLLLILLLTAKLPVWQRAVLIGAVLVLFLGGNRWVAMSLARSLEGRYWSAEALPSAEVAVVLGGGTLSADFPRNSVEVNGAGDRVLYAAQLYQQGKVERLLLSGGFLGWNPRNTSPAQDMAILLKDLGIPEGALWLEPDSRNTYENAAFSAKILKQNGIQKILLVTSAWHMQRAVKLFEAQGLDVVPAPVDFSVTQRDWEFFWQADWKTQLINLVPSAGSLSWTTLMMKEYYGILVYELKGWQ